MARHDAGGNEDEKAIAHALTQLGHTVECVQQEDGAAVPHMDAGLVLFHKWHDLPTLRRIAAPKAFYYFDLIDYPDPTLKTRCQTRLHWMADVVPLVDFGFLTDGDFVAKDKNGKLRWLPQGFDERLPAMNPRDTPRVPILFTGIGHGGGTQRVDFVEMMKGVYGGDFHHVPRGLHGPHLARAISETAIVVAPDSPVTNAYWSNRVFVTLGLGGFLLHPYCAKLTEQYAAGEEIVYYRDRAELHTLIQHYLAHPQERRRIAANGLRRTLAGHLYRHRCEELIRTVKEGL